MIRTKLSLPFAQVDNICRSSVLDKLDQGLDKKLFLIVAGAGYGKSTAISQWFDRLMKENGKPPLNREDKDKDRDRDRDRDKDKDRTRTRVAWVSLDSLDNDPVSFMKYFVSAIQMQLTSGLEDVLERINSTYVPNLEWVIKSCINVIEEEINKSKKDMPLSMILALDDFHYIKSKEILKSMAMFINYCPLGFKLLLISRELPQLPIMTYRSKGWTLEVDERDLAFDMDESMAFLEKVMDLKGEPSLLKSLVVKTEGWAAGLQLGALAISKENDGVKDVGMISGNHPYILEYLTQEVLKALPEKERVLLMVSSILDRFCIELASNMLEGIYGQSDLLDNPFLYLEERHYFIISLDLDKVWFRFHHLFAEVLSSQLKKWIKAQNALGLEVTMEKLHLVASKWYTENGYESEAFQHAVAAGEIDLCTNLLHSGSVPFLYRGGVGQAIKWLSRLPVEELNKRPWLWMIYASTSLHIGKTEDVEIRLLAAEKSMASCIARHTSGIQVFQKGEIEKLNGHIAAIKAVLYATQHHMERAF